MAETKGGTKEPLDEGKRAEWKSWLKTQHSENEDHCIRSHHFIANRQEKSENSDRFYFLGAPKALWMVIAAMKWKDAHPWKERCNKPIQCIKKQRHHFANKGLYSQSYGFSSSHVWMWELDHKEGWVRHDLATEQQQWQGLLLFTCTYYRSTLMLLGKWDSCEGPEQVSLTTDTRAKWQGVETLGHISQCRRPHLTSGHVQIPATSQSNWPGSGQLGGRLLPPKASDQEDQACFFPFLLPFLTILFLILTPRSPL